MATIRVDAGSCGFVSIVRAAKTGAGRVAVDIESDCAQVSEFSGRLDVIGTREIFHRPFNENSIYREAARSGLHSGCPLPCAVIKAVEVALGLALDKDVSLAFDRDETAD
jgi:hypothetical protein